MRIRCGELAALGMLAKGALRDAVAIIDSVSWGEGGTRTAAAIHGDVCGCSCVRDRFEDGSSRDGAGGVTRSDACSGKLPAKLKGGHYAILTSRVEIDLGDECFEFEKDRKATAQVPKLREVR